MRSVQTATATRESGRHRAAADSRSYESPVCLRALIHQHRPGYRGEANAAAIKSYNEEHGTHIIIRPVKYLNNIVERTFRTLLPTLSSP